MRTQRPQHQIRLGHLPIFARVVERLFLGPQFEDDLERLASHLAVLPGIAVDVEHSPIARQSAGGDTKIEPSLRHMVEHRNPVGQLRRMMIGQQKPAGCEPDMAGLHQRLRDQEIR
jgi:hypothetical protein